MQNNISGQDTAITIPIRFPLNYRGSAGGELMRMRARAGAFRKSAGNSNARARGFETLERAAGRPGQ